MVNAFRWMVFVIGLAVVIGSIMVTSAGDPIIVINSHSNGDTVSTDEITVSGSAMGTDGAVVESVIVTVNDHPHPADGTTTSWRKDISLQPGLNVITVEAKDNMGQSSSKPIEVIYIEPNSTPTNESSPTLTPTFTTIPNGGYRPTPAPTPTPTGSISITTIPPGAEVYLDGSFAGNTSITLTLEDVTEGPHRVKVSKDGFCSSKTRIKHLCAGETKELIIKLEPLTGSIVVSSTPSRASVYLDDVDMKANTTCMLNEVAVGQHTIKLTKSDYLDLISKVSVSGNSTPTYLHENLTGYGSINISSYPYGAKVYLDENYTGETPKNISKVVQGNHTIKLTKSDYFNVTGNVSVSVGRSHPVHVNLTECGYINISSNPSGANVSVDGNYMGKTPKNNYRVEVGKRTIKLTKSGYFDVIIRNVSVSAGETRHLDVNLTGYGSFRISSNPSKAKVYLDNVFKGITPLDIDEVVEGSYFIKLTKFCYGAVEKKIDVSAGKREPVDETLSVSVWWPLFAMLAAILLEEATIGFITKRIKIISNRRKKGYVFSWDSVPGDEKGYVLSWDSVPGDDDEKFKKTLRDDFDIGWAENVEIIKSDDGKTISISKDDNSAEIIIDEKKEKAILKICNCRTLDLKVKEENGKLNIYKKRK